MEKGGTGLGMIAPLTKLFAPLEKPLSLSDHYEQAKIRATDAIIDRPLMDRTELDQLSRDADAAMDRISKMLDQHYYEIGKAVVAQQPYMR